MSNSECNNTECTYSQTGICLLNKNPDDCSNRIFSQEKEGDETEYSVLDPITSSAAEGEAQIPPSAVLGMDDVRAVTRKEYCHLIGLLGTPGSGKTSCLVSLYLLLSHGRLAGFSFADSKSLVALDELSRGARRWQDGMPEQMTMHTERGDDRFPGFVHLKLRKKSGRSRTNLFIPDLPGEWTNSLIDRNRTDRLSFLKGADAIWVMVNGKTLMEKSQRLGELHRTKLIVDRITELCQPQIPTIRLVVSHLDLGQPDASSIRELQEIAYHHGIISSINQISSFSQMKEVPAGKGIAELVEQTVRSEPMESNFWPDASKQSLGPRNSLRIG